MPALIGGGDVVSQVLPQALFDRLENVPSHREIALGRGSPEHPDAFNRTLIRFLKGVRSK